MAIDWVSGFFRDVDAFQIEKLDAWFADDIDLRFANNPTIKDKKTALQALGGFYGTIAGLQHKAEALVGSGDEVAQQAIVTYTRKDGRRVPLPVSSYLRRNAQGKLNRLWIYIDINPLYAEIATK
jgi:SnoaL-like domain